jgi:hypothetical protein
VLIERPSAELAKKLKFVPVTNKSKIENHPASTNPDAGPVQVSLLLGK